MAADPILHPPHIEFLNNFPHFKIIVKSMKIRNKTNESMLNYNVIIFIIIIIMKSLSK